MARRDGKPHPLPDLSRLDRYLLRQTLVPFTWSIVFSVVAVFLFQAQRLIGAAAGLGLTATDVALIFSAALPPFLVLAVPMAFLLSVMIGFGRMASDRELVALSAAGASPARIARTPLFLGAVVSLATLPIAHFGEPYGLRLLYDRLVDVGLRNIAGAVEPGTFNEDFAGLAVFASRRDDRGRLEDLLLFDERDRDQPILIVAARGTLAPKDERSLTLRLEAGEIHLGKGSTRDRYERIGFDRSTLGIDAGKEMWARTKLVSDIAKMTSEEMIAESARRGQHDRYGRRVEKTYWRRWTLPLMALVFGVLAAAISLAAKPDSRAKNVLLAIGGLIFYHLLLRAGDWLVVQYPYSSAISAWGPNAVVLGIAVVALIRAGRPK